LGNGRVCEITLILQGKSAIIQIEKHLGKLRVLPLEPFIKSLENNDGGPQEARQTPQLQVKVSVNGLPAKNSRAHRSWGDQSRDLGKYN